MNLEELMILFIPEVAFFQGVKLSKVALRCSSTNKKIKELQLERCNTQKFYLFKIDEMNLNEFIL